MASYSTTINEDYLAASVVDRGVNMGMEEGGDLMSMGGTSVPQKRFVQGGDVRLAEMEFSQAGICSLPLQGDVGSILERVNNHLQERKIDFSSPNASEFVGYLFANTVYAYFQLVVFARKQNNEPGLRVRKLDGDAYLSANMFFELRKDLVEEGMVDLEADKWKDLDEEQIDLELAKLGNISDTESDGAAGEEVTHSAKYLELQNDVVEQWLKELQEPTTAVDERLNTALLCSHNSEVQTNAQLIVETTDGKFVEALIAIIVNPQNSLAMVRACCATLQNLVKLVPELPVSYKEVKALLDTFLVWNKEKVFSYQRPVTNSNDIQRLTSTTITLLQGKLNPSEAPEDVKEAIAQIKDYLESDLSENCDTDAANNLTNFIEFLENGEN